MVDQTRIEAIFVFRRNSDKFDENKQYRVGKSLQSRGIIICSPLFVIVLIVL